MDQIANAVRNGLSKSPLNVVAIDRSEIRGEFEVNLIVEHKANGNDAAFQIATNNDGKETYVVFGLGFMGEREITLGKANSANEIANLIVKNVKELEDDGWFNNED